LARVEPRVRVWGRVVVDEGKEEEGATETEEGRERNMETEVKWKVLKMWLEKTELLELRRARRGVQRERRVAAAARLTLAV
jgi:hypothetical protein